VLESPNNEILVVDDEVAIVTFVSELLAEEGHTIRTAYDGAQAVDAITARPPTLVLLDYSMPHLTGADVLRQVRQSGSTLPIIMMSAEGQAQPFLAQGANAFLYKPFDLHVLLDTVAQYCAPLADERPAGVSFHIDERRRAPATQPMLRQLLATSRELHWDARWLSANSQRLQQRSLGLRQASERLRKQSIRLFRWP